MQRSEEVPRITLGQFSKIEGRCSTPIFLTTGARKALAAA